MLLKLKRSDSPAEREPKTLLGSNFARKYT